MGKTSRTVFRKLTTEDAEIVAALDLKCFSERGAFSREDFLSVAQNKNCEYIVGERDGKIIACAGAEIHLDTAEIGTIAVDPEYRRQGIATLLFIKLLVAIKERGATFMVLEVRPSNTAAINLYEGFGFEIVEREKNFYGDEDAWIMVKDFS